jgi:hypothetical protein
MIPYVSIAKKMRKDEDFETVFLRVSSINGVLEIPLTPVQQILLARELLDDFDLDRIENG